MINSLFVVNNVGDIFIEKHWKSVISRSVCDHFFEALSKANSPEDVPPVIAAPHHYLISIYRNDLFFLAVVQSEVPPLFVIEFLHRVVDTFTEYFNSCNETSIKEHVVVVFELLEEMLDNGFPLATEPNILRELINPPSIVRQVVNTVTGGSHVSSHLPTGQLSNVPWRRTGVKYTHNEIYFDVIEEIDCIIDRHGSTVFTEIQGVIDSCCKLSGMPDLSLSFVNSRLLEDPSFHPCVRLKRWEGEKVLSFVPPDGNYRLLSYHITAGTVAIPVYAKPQISYQEGGSGRFDLTVGPKQTMGKVVEDVVVTVPFPKQVLNVNLTPSVGTCSFDPVKKELVWDIGKIIPQKLPNLRGNMSLQTGVPPPDESCTISYVSQQERFLQRPVKFKISQLAASGLKVSRLDIYGEKYKPFKGVKYLTKAGKFQIRV